MSRRAKSKDTRTSPRNVPRAPEQPAEDLRSPGRPVGDHPIAAKRPGEATRPEVEPTADESPPRPPPGPVIISGAQAAALGEAKARKRQAGTPDTEAGIPDAGEDDSEAGGAEDPSTPDLGEAAGNPGTASALTLATGMDVADLPPTSDAAVYAEETPVVADQRSAVDPVRVVDAASLVDAAIPSGVAPSDLDDATLLEATAAGDLDPDLADEDDDDGGASDDDGGDEVDAPDDEDLAQGADASDDEDLAEEPSSDGDDGSDDDDGDEAATSDDDDSDEAATSDDDDGDEADASDEENEDDDTPSAAADDDGATDQRDEMRTHVQAERPVASPEAIDRDDLRLNPGPVGTDEAPDDDVDNTSIADEVDRQRHGGER